MSDDF